jgi:DNA-directed RNA polymerase subunit M/transcription elongation factor TFIIS
MKPVSKDSKGENVWKCESCNITKESKSMMDTTEKIKKKEIGEGVAREVHGLWYPHKCKKCGYEKADIDILNPFYSDESVITLYRCQKCGLIERQTDGTGNM